MPENPQDIMLSIQNNTLNRIRLTLDFSVLSCISPILIFLSENQFITKWQTTFDFTRRFGVRRLRRNPNCVEGDCGAPANKAQPSCGRRRIFVAETEHAFREANGGAACKICCPPCRLASATSHRSGRGQLLSSSRCVACEAAISNSNECQDF